MVLNHFTAAVGPLWSHGGFRNWNLLLANEGILAWPYRFSESVRLLFCFAIGFPQDPGEAVRQENASGFEATRALYDRTCQTFLVPDLHSIVMVNRHGANEIQLRQLNGVLHTFHVFRRRSTSDYRSTLEELYPALYKEQGFPTSRLGKVLKG